MSRHEEADISPLSQGIQEGNRSWNAKKREIEDVLKRLESLSQDPKPVSLVENVQLLRNVTANDSRDASVKAVDAAHRLITDFAINQPHLAAKGLAQEQQEELVAKQQDEISEVMEQLNDELEGEEKDDGTLGDGMMTKMMIANEALLEFEKKMQREWHEKKTAVEQCEKNYYALTAMRYALHALMRQSEWSAEDPADFLESMKAAAPPPPPAPHSIERPRPPPPSEPPAQRPPDLLPIGEDTDALPDHLQNDLDLEARTVGDEAASTVASEVLDREEERKLKENHPGSREHPYGCRACHFQGGLCWKAYDCSFCHICPKPKRKSKHQRDVDKRRQERYKTVKDELGINCLDELTKIDDSRRQIMTSSEELKKRVKEAYQAGGSREKIKEVQEIVQAMQRAMDIYHAQNPDLLTPDTKGPLLPAAQGQVAASPPPPPPPPLAEAPAPPGASAFRSLMPGDVPPAPQREAAAPVVSQGAVAGETSALPGSSSGMVDSAAHEPQDERHYEAKHFGGYPEKWDQVALMRHMDRDSGYPAETQARWMGRSDYTEGYPEEPPGVVMEGRGGHAYDAGRPPGKGGGKGRGYQPWLEDPWQQQFDYSWNGGYVPQQSWQQSPWMYHQ